ncbi:MAG TPA: GntR family transcriptional regulator [Rhodothermales bacterium]|nr:GntR family transcriptional regulator [Rhodothermales bacterium]
MQAATSQESLADKAYAVVEEMIVTLALPPGQVFSEAELSQQINIGRTPLREALQRLAADRLVTTLPRKGVMVTEIKIAEHLALLETRRVLDRLIATRAARRATPDQREALQEGVQAIEQAAAEEDLAAFMRLDRAYDAILEAASRNPFATTAAEPLHTHCRRFWYRHRHDGDLAQSAALHASILRAVAAGDEAQAAAASDALIDYLETFTRATVDLF